MQEIEKYNQWLNQEGLDGEVRAQLEKIKDDKNEIFESFYKDLEFGTAGLRGILGTDNGVKTGAVSAACHNCNSFNFSHNKFLL